jgi:AcrR family transcriptional regulator
MPRLTREEQKVATRAALVEAARSVFARRGFQAATVEEIAAEAGFSTGAVYSNFGGKDDLVLAVVDETIAAELREYAELFARGRDVDERARGGADRWMELLHEEPDYFPLFMELWAAARRDPELRERLASRMGAMRDLNARLIEAGAADLSLEVPEGFADQMGVLINALGNGLAIEKLIDPDGVPDELFGWTLALLFRALVRDAREGVPR